MLTIIIVSWNVRDLLCECLQALADDGVCEWAEVVVVDNCSTDGTTSTVATRFPWVRLDALQENIGFSRGNNLVLRNCQSEFVLLLNPDTVPYPGVVRALVDHAIENPNCGAVGPRQVGRDGGVQFDGAVSLPTIWNVACEWLKLNLLFKGSRVFDARRMGYWDHLDARAVPAIPGSAMLLRTSALCQVGLLDETMFIIEDMDLCRRLQDAKWGIEYLGTVAILHYGGESLRKRGDGFKCQVAYQSFWLYLRKHEGRISAACLVGFVLLWSVAVLLLVRLARLFVSHGSSSSFERAHQWGSSLLTWAMCSKLEFNHGLASPPSESR
jgi:GT2 family glycosyltransferase